MKIRLLFIVIFASGIVSRSISQDKLVCLINPPFLTFNIPVEGFIPVDTSLSEFPCETITDSLWQRQPTDTFDLMIAVNGPFGSGRYWNVTVGLAESGQIIPNRGVCLNTSTIGCRTLQSLNNLPLKWIDDIDKDGLPEIIIWDSFPLHREASNAEYGLIAWVFEYNGKNEFTINQHLTNEIIKEIALAYRKPIKNAQVRFLNKRQDIARILDNFISQNILQK